MGSIHIVLTGLKKTSWKKWRRISYYAKDAGGRSQKWTYTWRACGSTSWRRLTKAALVFAEGVAERASDSASCGPGEDCTIDRSLRDQRCGFGISVLKGLPP